ncbi:MAG: DUF4118 domain-containing protein [Hydrogenophaga sp.]|uniref:sensor histidine kinase n=1 Tax=Hydrogenophaga sp. TaxID=1904254 RepID=UPI00257C32E6|nr:DUF4118 domain-containing protein [Hydrogenophaga sp.]MBL0943225.1 DUF4118 domain-containing protein [Hydrogenophaga sp.]
MKPPRLHIAHGRGLWRMLAVLLLCTGVAALISPHLHPINLTLIYLVGTVYLALREDLRWALLSVPVALLVYSWLYVEPRWSVIPTDPQYFLTFGIALVVGSVVSRLAARARDTAEAATAAARRAQALGALAQALADADSESAIGETLTRAVQAHTGCTATLLPAAPDRTTAAGWGLPLQAAGEVQGWLRLQGAGSEALDTADRELLATMAQQAAMALARRRLARRHLGMALQAEAERARSTLLASISHDFRTPLTTIIGAASTVLDQAGQVPPAQQVALVGHVLAQARRLQAMGSDLLELARLEGGNVQAQPEWVPADDLVREALEPVLDALHANRLVLQVPPEATVWCDVRLCSQVIANLVLNAAQHGPAGGAIEVGIEVEPGRWHLSVRDEGPGWTGDGPLTPPPEGGSRRAHGAPRANASGGSGLGLAICEVVARLHGGTLGVRHERGACIAMALPLPGPPPALEGTT